MPISFYHFELTLKYLPVLKVYKYCQYKETLNVHKVHGNGS